MKTQKKTKNKTEFGKNLKLFLQVRSLFIHIYVSNYMFLVLETTHLVGFIMQLMKRNAPICKNGSFPLKYPS